MNGAALVIRLTLSLAVVLMLMWGAAKLLRRTSAGGGGAQAHVLEVIARKSLSRNASVAVVRVADRAFVVGVTEQGIGLLAETDVAAIEASAPPREVREPLALPTRGRSVLQRGARAGRPVAATDLADALTAEADEIVLDDASATDEPDGPDTARGRGGRAGAPLAGSVLSPTTWRQTVDVLRERTVRAG